MERRCDCQAAGREGPSEQIAAQSRSTTKMASQANERKMKMKIYIFG